MRSHTTQNLSFIHNANKISGPKRSIKITDHFMCMAICGLSLHLGNPESRKTLEQKFIFQIGILNPIGINERFSFY